jgi:hypothetical protein
MAFRKSSEKLQEFPPPFQRGHALDDGPWNFRAPESFFDQAVVATTH